MTQVALRVAKGLFWSPTTIGERSEAVGNRSTGFDYIRILLSTSIIIYHSVSLSYGVAAEEALKTTIAGPFIAAIVPMFFALSGYLVAASLDRCRTLITFVGLRVLRICPALAVETLLSAFIIGPLFTVLSPSEYWSDPMLWSYLKNIYGDIHFTLPGLFQDLPKPYFVNGQLWTIKPELFCYVTLSLIVLLGARRHRVLVPASVVALLAGIFVLKIFLHVDAPLAVGGSWSHIGLVVIFLMGVGLHKYREKVAWSHGLGIACCLASIVLLCFSKGHYFAYAPVAYATVYLGLFNPRKIALLGGDYSYGMYLYGFVIQQAFASMGPWTHVWWLSSLVCVPAAWLFAVASWHFIEKPAQSLRAPLKRFEAAFLRTRRASAV